MKKLYEYWIVTKDGAGVFDLVNTRNEARLIKSSLQKDDEDVKIVQRKYVLESEKEVR